MPTPPGRLSGPGPADDPAAPRAGEPPGVGEGGLRGWVSHIQAFSLHDGPGIRTTVFLQGCPLRCAWCANPEAQEARGRIVHWEDRCLGCDVCLQVCPRAAIVTTSDRGRRVLVERCDLCGLCLEACYPAALEQVGRSMTVAEVLAAVEADMPFYAASQGGMTLSGGEPTAQPEFCLALLRGARRLGIATALETCGEAPWHVWRRLVPSVDLILYDVKEVDPGRHRVWTGSSNELILSNLRRLVGAGAAVRLRRPLIPGCNDDEESLAALAHLAADLGLRQIDVLPYHGLARGKYHRLGRVYEMGDLASVRAEDLSPAVEFLTARGFEVEVGG